MATEKSLNETPQISNAVEISGFIGWDTTVQSVKNSLRGTKNEAVIEIYADSFGGFINTGFAVHDMLHSHPANLTFRVMNQASAMTVITAAARKEGDRVIMSENGKYMMHEVQGGAFGESSDFEKMAKMMNQENDRIATIYSRKGNLPVAQFRAMMKEETWLTASQAKSFGLVDEVVESIDFHFAEEPEDENWNSLYVPGAQKPPQKAKPEDFGHKMSDDRFNYFLNFKNTDTDMSKEKTAKAVEPTETPGTEAVTKVVAKVATPETTVETQTPVTEPVAPVVAKVETPETTATTTASTTASTVPNSFTASSLLAEMENRQKAVKDAHKTEIETLTNAHTEAVNGLNTKVLDLETKIAELQNQVNTANTAKVKAEGAEAEAIANLKKITNTVAALNNSEGAPHTLESLIEQRNTLLKNFVATPKPPVIAASKAVKEGVEVTRRSFKDYGKKDK